MKKKNIYLLSIAFFAIAVTCIIYRYQSREQEKQQTVYTIVPRKNSDTSNAEWKGMLLKAGEFQASIQNNPTDYKSLNGLAALFIQEARNTGNYAYYDMAAMHQINQVLTIDSTNFEALVYKSLIQLSQHHFADGLETATKAKNINPYNAYVYGLMVDGYVEMGAYEKAIEAADKMISIRPDLSSYSRLSYLREIYGDYNGAITAMKMAVEAGGPGDENTEWARTQMAQLLEKTGDYKNAEQLYTISLQLRKNYPHALAGLGRVALAKHDYPTAISYFETAAAIAEDNSVLTELANAYTLSGNAAMAEKTTSKNIEALSANAKAGMDDENMGHYADRELAYAFVESKDYDRALEHALMEYNRRPENIDVNETLAWVYYKMGDYKKAGEHINTALKTHSKNPVLLGRAALIYSKLGDVQTAKMMISESAGNIAAMDFALSKEIQQTL